jgi:hypothetical protein
MEDLTTLKIVGTLLVVCSVVGLFLWCLVRKENVRRGLGWAAVLGVIAGLALTLQDRITELPLPGFGTIRAAAQQASADASTFGKLKERV